MSGGRGFIGRIARYGSSLDRDPREDRLTAICAAIGFPELRISCG